MHLDKENSATSESEAVVTTSAAKKGKGKAPSKASLSIEIPALKLAVVTFTIKGLTSLIVHNFGPKGKRQMLDKQMGEVHKKRQPKDPTACFLESLHVISGKPKIVEKGGGFLNGGTTYAEGDFGFPANALKLAAVSACRHLDGLAMTKALGTFRVMDYYIPILDAKTGKRAVANMREDVVRLKDMARTADLRYRGEFKNWMMKVSIQYNTAVINPTQIANLLNTAGFTSGLGEWRMEKRGDFGQFQVA